MLSERATAAQAAEVLYLVLKRDIDYLYRYHAAVVLIKLLRIRNIKPVDLSGNRADMNRELVSLADTLKERRLLN